MRATTLSFRRGGWSLLLAVLFPLLASGQTGGTITGQVSNNATQSYLEGAVVELLGTGRTAITDREGRYQFTGVTPATVTLVVSFTGLDAKRIPLSVSPGERVVQNVELTAEIYRLDKFTVAGEREGTAKAETLQRQAPNVKAIVSSDTFGNVADGNIGDMLQHMAGITADYNGPDVRQVSIRGVGSALNSVTMDGQQVASAQSAGTGRQFEFEQASLGQHRDNRSDESADAGHGWRLDRRQCESRDEERVRPRWWSLHFLSGSGSRPSPATPDRRMRNGSSRSRASGRPPISTTQDVLGAKRNIGITLTGLIHSQPVGGAIIANTFERRDAPGPVFNSATTRTMVNGATRSRIATGLKLDYRLSESTTFTLNTSYNFFHENNDNDRMRWRPSASRRRHAQPAGQRRRERQPHQRRFHPPRLYRHVHADLRRPASTSVVTMTSERQIGPHTISFRRGCGTAGTRC